MWTRKSTQKIHAEKCATSCLILFDVTLTSPYGTFELNMKLKEDIERYWLDRHLSHLDNQVQHDQVDQVDRTYTQGMSSPQTFCAISKPVGSCHANNSTLTPFRAICAVLADSFPAWKRSDDTHPYPRQGEVPASWVQSALAHFQEGKSWCHSPSQTIALALEPLITGNKSDQIRQNTALSCTSYSSNKITISFIEHI